VPSQDRGLLARLAARATGLAGPAGAEPATRPGGRGRAMVEWDAVELLRCVAEGVGLVRVRGDRLEATSLRHAWARFDEGCAQGSPVRPGAMARTGRTVVLGGSSSARDVGLWPRGGPPAVDHLQGVL